MAAVERLAASAVRSHPVNSSDCHHHCSSHQSWEPRNCLRSCDWKPFGQCLGELATLEQTRWLSVGRDAHQDTCRRCVKSYGKSSKHSWRRLPGPMLPIDRAHLWCIRGYSLGPCKSTLGRFYRARTVGLAIDDDCKHLMIGNSVSTVLDHYQEM